MPGKLGTKPTFRYSRCVEIPQAVEGLGEGSIGGVGHWYREFAGRGARRARMPAGVAAASSRGCFDPGPACTCPFERCGDTGAACAARFLLARWSSGSVAIRDALAARKARVASDEARTCDLRVGSRPCA